MSKIVEMIIEQLRDCKKHTDCTEERGCCKYVDAACVIRNSSIADLCYRNKENIDDVLNELSNLLDRPTVHKILHKTLRN